MAIPKEMLAKALAKMKAKGAVKKGAKGKHAPKPTKNMPMADTDQDMM